MTPTSPVLTTERLILRPLQRADADDLFAYQSDAATVQYIPWPERTHAEVVAALDKYAPSAAELPAQVGDFALLGWELRSSGQVIGQSNLQYESADNRQASIGWVTHPAFIRQGYALEATSALIGWAFAELNLHRLTATIDTRNTASAFFAERLGMRREAEHVEDEWFKGEWTSTWVYAMLAREWSLTK